MYNAVDESLFIEYKFTIDTIPPAVEVTTLSGIGVEQNGATNQSFYLTWDEADASVHYSLAISSTTSKSYVKGTMLSSKGLYTFTIKDAVGNILTFTVYLDNQCDVGFEGNFSTREDGTIVTNSAITVRQKEEYKVFTVSADNGITVRLDTAFSANGTYELFFQDLYLNTVSYIVIINNIPPIITLSGVVADATTSSDVKVDFDKGNGVIEYNKETFSCAAGQTVTEHGAYKVIVKDEFGNIATVKFAIDKKVEYKSNVACGIVTTSRVTLEFTEKLKDIELKINGSVANPASSSFNDSGLYEIMAEDLFGNQLIFTFTIIEAKTKATEFIAPNGFDISYVQKSGTMLELNNTQVFNYCGDGVYTIALAEKQTSCVYAFDIEVDTTKPSLSIVYSDDGKEVTFANLTKDVTGTLTLDGKEIAWTPNKVLKDVGKYKLIIVDELGNEVIYEFEIIRHLNVWAIISIVIVVLIIAAVIFLIVKAKKTKAE